MVTAEFILEEPGLMHAFSYENYLSLGGIINEGDCNDALARARSTVCLEKSFICQAEHIASVAGIFLNNSRFHLDKITVLYGVLRGDMKPGAEYHHGQMGDQRLFVEVIRMLNRPDLLEKLVAVYPPAFFA